MSDVLEKLPKACVFCGRSKDDADGFQFCFSTSFAGEAHYGALCEGCIRLFIIEMAYSNREKFEQTVEEARNWKPGDP